MDEKNLKTIAEYKIVEIIREVPEGILYKAVDPSSNKSVLIKLYLPTLRWSEGSLNDFFDRMSYLKFIEHEYLLPILEVGKYKQKPYVVYPWEAYRFLADRETIELDEIKAVNIFHKIAQAVDFLHTQEILHGALNTENILLDAGGAPKLLDYGLVEVLKKLLMENAEDNFYNLGLSNVKFSSPEQLLGRNPTRSSDMYSFGLLLYFGIVGEFLFGGNLSPQIALLHLSRHVLQLSKPAKEISRSTLRFIQKCIQVDPGMRFVSFAEIVRILDRMVEGRSTRFSFKRRFVFRAPKKQSKQGWLYLGVVVFLAGLSTWFYLSNPGKPYSAAPATLTMIPVNTFIPPETRTPDAIQSEAAAATAGTTAQLSLDQAMHKPAFEGEIPELPTQVISMLNLKQVGEISRLGYGKPEDVSFSSDTRYFAVGMSAGVFIYYENRLSKWIDPQSWVTSVKFSPNGKTLAVGLDSGDIQIWDWANEIKISTLKGHSAKVSRILYSKNGLFLYSASFDQHIIVWNLQSNSSIQDIAAHTTRVNDMAVSSDGRILVTCSNDQLIRVWDAASGKKIFEIPFPGSAKAVAISSDDIYIAAGGEAGYIRQWDVKTQQLRTDPIPVKKRIWNLQYIETDTKLLAGIDNGEYKTYNAAQKSYGGTSLNFKIDPVSKFLIQKLGSEFLYDSYTISDGTANNFISIRWDGEVNHQNSGVLKPFYDSLDRLDFSNDGKTLAAGGKRGITSVWDIRNNQFLYKDAAELPFGDPISPDGSSIVVGQSIYQAVNLSNTANKIYFSESIPDGVISYADGGSVVISSNLEVSKVWDFATGYETFFITHPDTGCRLTISANNQEILQVNSSVGVLPAWNDSVKSICSKSLLYRGSPSAAARDQKFLVYRNGDGLVEGFDMVKNQVLWKYKPEKNVTALAVSPDGLFVVMGDDSGRMMFLDSGNGELLADTMGNFGALQAIIFSVDGKYIATAGEDGVARLLGVIENNQ